MSKPAHLHPVALALLGTALLAGCEMLPKPAEGAATSPAPATRPVATAPTSTFPGTTPAPGVGTVGSPPAGGAPSAGPSGAAAPVAGAPRPVAAPPSGPPPFAAVIREARRIEGPLTLWQKDDKVWIELLPTQFDKPFLLSPKIKDGIGEAFVLGGLMAYPVNGAGGPQVVEFVRVHSQVRLQARNTDIAAKPGTPEARAVASSYSNSLLGATAVVSQPHPDRKSVLIEANPLFLNDMLGVAMMLQRGLRQGYGLDRSNSVITGVRASEGAIVIETQNHYFTGSVGVPGMGGPPNAPVPLLPRFLPDARSLLVGLHFSLAPLPDEPMKPRRADPRLGLFTSTVVDFSDDLQSSPRQRYVNRWRLEKKDPAAEMSEPVKPITFWIDRNVPLVYRETVRAAVLEWNKAFEKIGISGALKVEQQADDAKFDTLDFGYPSVRWMMNADPVFGAIGPSHVDPRSGEILDADIAFEGMSARNVRTLRSQVLRSQATGSLDNTGAAANASPLNFAQPFTPPQGVDMPAEFARCMHGALAAEQLGYALDVLEARGEMDPDSPIARQFVQDYVKEAIMHEVGHALGLRHNFRASRAYTEAQLADAEFTRAHGTSGSVMEYNAVNLPRPGQPGGVPFHTALGPYDYWAIEYAYKPMAAGTTAVAERAELQRIAARSSEVQLAFGTDEDNFFGLDPETIQLDLGNDPLAFASKRLAIARDLFKRQESRELPPDRDYAVLRRSIGFAINDATRAVGVLVRQIGGVRTLRDFPGSGREPLQPVSAQHQREALDMISRSVLSPEGLSLTPALQRRMAPDFLDRAEGGGATDFSVPQRLLDLQRAVLNYLMSDTIATRILDSVGKFDQATDAFQLRELHDRLSSDVWNELGSHPANGPAPITAARRDLQRDHVNRLALAVVRPSGTGRADIRGQLREQARTLLARLDTTLRKRGAVDDATRAHLADSADTLRQALSASIQRQAL
ncbi:MAG: zinc-dependent metalloprotease [Rubrivivax sp.]|nr:zinc-dependent metalloprotease [Rubrivivax sp.]